MDFTGEMNEDVLMAAERLAKGGKIVLNRQVGPGELQVTIYPAESRYNVNRISEEQWEQLFESTQVPEELWDELVDCFLDWADENDLHRVNGAESDDSFYEERGYKVKNAPLDTISELTMIKGFTEEIVYGKEGEISEKVGRADAPTGLIQHLTTWSSGCINPNAASAETLLTLPGIFDWQVDSMMEYLRGPDGIEGTEDDELFENVDEAMDIGGLPGDLKEFLCVTEVSIHRVESVGTIDGPTPVKSMVTAMVKREGDTVSVAMWNEEPDL